MKTFLLSICVVTLGLTICNAQDVPCNDIVKLTSQLKSIKDSDQDVRASLIKMMSQPIDPVQFRLLNTRMQGIDKANQLYVGKMLDQCGWPKGLEVSENNAIYLVILHATDTTFMEKYFALVKQQADNGMVEKSDRATLQDKLLMRKGLKQLYGTQAFKALGDQALTLWPIDDPDRLADRRRDVGMLPLDDYLALMKTTFGSDMVWDKNLTLEDAKNATKKKQ